MPVSTSRTKSRLIEKRGGCCHFVENAAEVNAEAHRIADETGGHFHRSVHQRRTGKPIGGQQTISPSRYSGRWEAERHPIPSWIVVGTAVTQCDHRSLPCATGVIPPGCASWDPENCLLPAYSEGRCRYHDRRVVAHEGIGRPWWSRLSATVIDRMDRCPRRRLGGGRITSRCCRRVGPDRNQCLGCFGIARRDGGDRCQRGSVVTLICDGGERYGDTHRDEEWLTDARPGSRCVRRRSGRVSSERFGGS